MSYKFGDFLDKVLLSNLEGGDDIQHSTAQEEGETGTKQPIPK